MVYLSNAFSLGMLSIPNSILNVQELQDKHVKAILNDGFVSAVGHQSTADFMSTILGMNIPLNRISVSLNVGDTIIVLQLQGRLPEGKILSQEEISTIPYKWLMVEVLDADAPYLAV